MRATSMVLASFALVASALAFPASDELRISVEQAVAALDAAEQDKRWYFTMALVEENQESIIHHDPSKDPLEQRTLLRFEGKEPDKKQLKEFRKKEEQRIEDKDPDANYSYLVDTATLEQASADNGLVELNFSPRIKRMEDFRDDFAGKLIFNTRTAEIERIEIFSTAAFSPAFSVTLESYKLSFTFRDESGARLLDEMVSIAVGKAGFLKKFNAETRISFSDYQPAAAADTTE